MKFPKNFNHHSKPYKPQKPPEEIDHYETVSQISTYRWDHIDMASLPAATHMTVDSTEDDGMVVLTFSNKKRIPNHKYKRKLAEYNERYQQYKKDLVEWSKWDALWLEEEAKKELKRKQNLLKRLKKELGE